MYRFHLILTLLFSASQLFAQEPNLLIYGKVNDWSTGDSIPFPSVQFQDVTSGSLPMLVVPNSHGRYEFVLDVESIFKIIYSAPGKVSKFVQIDTRGPTAQD